MTRLSFDQMLRQLKDQILILGSMVEQSTIDAVDALIQRDTRKARMVYTNDQMINEKRYSIENAVLVQMATQQPMAQDLRLLIAILEVITELERMGDYAKGIAKVALMPERVEMPIPAQDFRTMADQVVTMLHNGVTAFISGNELLARSIPPEDDQVDDLYNRIYRKIVTEMISNPETINHGNGLMWVAHNLERLGDRVVNICERTLFIQTGELAEMEFEELNP